VKVAAHLKVAPNEQRAAPLRIHNRQKTGEGNVQGRWEAGGSQTRPYVAVKSAARICRAMRTSNKGSGPPKGGPYVVSEYLQWNKVYET